jgi:hypothetical protein
MAGALGEIVKCSWLDGNVFMVGWQLCSWLVGKRMRPMCGDRVRAPSDASKPMIMQ